VASWSQLSERPCAVSELYLAVAANETLGLLGPNGAGKSTTLSVLSGVLSPTSGRCVVGGFDVSTELSSVYTHLGVCTQHDVVWPDLTVRQHLQFYARVKGVSSAYEGPLVQRIAEMVRLDGDPFWQPASALSGGMKRRLSLAVSLIGNPSIWVLDEPTTGLSPEARRTVWSIISAQKSYGRSIVLTTHAMDEADVLCNRIAIICSGRLQCIGTQQTLKQKFGDGFKLTLHMHSPTDFNLDEALTLLTTRRQDRREAEATEAVIGEEKEGKGEETSVTSPHPPLPASLPQDGSMSTASVTGCVLEWVLSEVYPSAVLLSAVGRKVQFGLSCADEPGQGGDPRARQLRAVLSVFERMEQANERLLRVYRIREWSVSQASLEEVFINVVRQAGRTEDL
jgi:ABC-type multidrug transport system ATPase subunit